MGVKIPTSRNTKLFDHIADIIESYPEAHDQGGWGGGDREIVDISFSDGDVVRQVECGTTHCIAGWAAVLTGGHPVLEVEGDETVAYWDHVSDRSGVTYSDGSYQDDYVDVDEWARAALGITSAEAENLFDADWRVGAPKKRIAAELREIGRGKEITD